MAKDSKPTFFKSHQEEVYPATFLNIIGALDRPSSGRVYINGINTFSSSDSQIATLRNNTIGFIFQSYNLINMTT
jgi:putative ABC transport system ATP-binding protein